MRPHAVTSVEQGWTNHKKWDRKCHWIYCCAPNNCVPSVWDLLSVTVLMFRIFRCFLDFGGICARLMWGSGSISPLVLNINIRWSCQLFTPHRRRLIPQGCSFWYPFSRRQGRAQIKSGRFGRIEEILPLAGNRTLQFKVLLTWSCRLPVALNTSPVCRVQYCANHCRTLMHHILWNLELYADFDVYMAGSWQMVDTIPVRSHYWLTLCSCWVHPLAQY